MYIKGYKAFNSDMTNRYGIHFEVGNVYICSDQIKFKLSGYHLCRNFEDTFRYFDSFSDNVKLCSVRGYGDVDVYNDEYYGYYDMYSVQKLYICKILSREEIFNMALELPLERLKRFVSLYKLNDDELKSLNNISKELYKVIEYYQHKNLKVYERR